MKRIAMFAFAALTPLVAAAGVTEVKLKLPTKPKLQISGDEKIAIAPFVIVANQEKKNDRAAKIDVQKEFQRYLKKQLGKSTKLHLVDAPQMRLPGTDIKSLEADRVYWKQLGAKSGADYIISGIIDFDVNDKSGYKSEDRKSVV